MNWRKLFEKRILDRGYVYCYENAVEDMSFCNDIIRATVIGTDDYEVVISLRNGEIEDMYCSCPYASDGNNCKHMAAVLYEWYENNDDLKSDEEETYLLCEPTYTARGLSKKQEAVQKLVADAAEEEIRSFLISVLTENDKLCLRFHNMVSKQAKKVDIKSYFRQIDAIKERYLGITDFIEYYEATDFVIELEEIIDNDVQLMIDNKNYSDAFEVLNHIFIVIGTVDIDDSDGETGELGHKIYQIWAELLEKVNLDEKRKMFAWFTAHTDGSVVDYLEDFIILAIKDNFNEKEYEQDKLDYYRSMIEKSKRNCSAYNIDYTVSGWIVRYLELLENKNTEYEQLAEECKKYWEYSSARKFYVEMCIRKKDYNKALAILDESISMDKEYIGLVREFSQRKKDIYQLQGDKTAYVEQLWKLVLEHAVGNMDFYKELKQQYSSDKWLILREKVFNGLPKYTDIAKYYKEEKMYDELLDCVLKSNGLYKLEQYEKVLLSKYTEQVLEKYKNEVNKMAKHTGTRKNYSDLVALLRRMKRIKGGSKVVGQIVEHWKNEYKNRPAMMDELSKL